MELYMAKSEKVAAYGILASIFIVPTIVGGFVGHTVEQREIRQAPINIAAAELSEKRAKLMPECLDLITNTRKSIENSGESVSLSTEEFTGYSECSKVGALALQQVVDAEQNIYNNQEIDQDGLVATGVVFGLMAGSVLMLGIWGTVNRKRIIGKESW
jgi:hypothetical protein